MEMKKPFEGRPNEAALAEQRNKYLDDAIDKVLSSEWWLDMLKKQREDALGISQNPFAVWKKLAEINGYNYSQDLKEGFVGKHNKLIEEIKTEYPADVVLPRVEEKLKLFLEQKRNQYIDEAVEECLKEFKEFGDEYKSMRKKRLAGDELRNYFADLVLRKIKKNHGISKNSAMPTISEIEKEYPLELIAERVRKLTDKYSNFMYREAKLG